MTTSVSEGIDKLLWIMVCVLPLYGVGRMFRLRKKAADHINYAREVALALFALFMFGLLMLTFENHGFSWLRKGIVPMAWNRLKSGIGVNFVPFRTIRGYMKHASVRGLIMTNIVGNIVMFLPWGLGLPLLWKKYQNLAKLTVASLLLPIGIEFIQLFIGRSVDVDDVILNFAGGMLGGLLYWLLVRVIPKLKELAE